MQKKKWIKSVKNKCRYKCGVKNSHYNPKCKTIFVNDKCHSKGELYLWSNYEISPETVKWVFYFKYFVIARFKMNSGKISTDKIVIRFL